MIEKKSSSFCSFLVPGVSVSSHDFWILRSDLQKLSVQAACVYVLYLCPRPRTTIKCTPLIGGFYHNSFVGWLF